MKYRICIFFFYFSEDDEQIRQNTYGTIPRSISEVSLQSNPKRKNSLPSVSEDNDLSTTSTSHSSPTRTENEKKHENNSKPMSFKKHSMADVGLAKVHFFIELSYSVF